MPEPAYSAFQHPGAPSEGSPEGTADFLIDASFQPGEMDSGISGFGGALDAQAASRSDANSKLVCRLQITFVSVTASIRLSAFFDTTAKNG